jgi:hypothetical protein
MPAVQCQAMRNVWRVGRLALQVELNSRGAADLEPLAHSPQVNSLSVLRSFTQDVDCNNSDESFVVAFQQQLSKVWSCHWAEIEGPLEKVFGSSSLRCKYWSMVRTEPEVPTAFSSACLLHSMTNRTS